MLSGFSIRGFWLMDFLRMDIDCESGRDPKWQCFGCTIVYLIHVTELGELGFKLI